MARRDAIARLFVNLAQELRPSDLGITNLFAMQPHQSIGDHYDDRLSANAIPCVEFLKRTRQRSNRYV